MHKLITGFVFSIFLLSTTAPVLAATDTVAPLKQLSVVSRLAQSLGLNTSEVQSELDAGKTLEQIAKENGMPESVFKSRVLQGDFSITAGKTQKKTTKVTIKKPTPKLKTALKKLPPKKPAKKLIKKTK